MTRGMLAVVVLLGLAAGASPAAAQHEGHPPQQPPAPQEAPRPEPPAAVDHSQHQHAPADLPSFIPRLTDEDRKAAFPDLGGHAAHDRKVHSFLLFDQLEWQAHRHDAGIALDSKGWVGRDRDRLWFRAEGGSEGGRVTDGQVHFLYGRPIARWWDVVGGIRQDFRPGPAQTWAAVGLQGLAPYWFEIEATAYLGAAGRTHARVEVEYELLLTNRLVAQPRAEVELFGKSDPERGVGAGLSTSELGLRLRYEMSREFAPYAGVAWRTRWGKTAELADAAGESSGGARLVTGLRLWF
jgi:copper resistance protein B